MKPIHCFRIFPILLATGFLPACGHKHETGDGHHHGKSDGHGHEGESPSGAFFKPGTGVFVTAETRKILDLQTAVVGKQQLPLQIRFNLQVFGEKHHHPIQEDDHTGCDVHGSGFVPLDQAKVLRPGSPAQVQVRTNESLSGVVLAVDKATSLGEAEVIVGLTNAAARIKPGDFLSAVVTLQREAVVTVIPRTALLRTAEGKFVYTVNGDAYFRTPVKIGAEANDLLEVTDGLLADDAVVTKPVETLYLIELRATKGGGHAH